MNNKGVSDVDFNTWAEKSFKSRVVVRNREITVVIDGGGLSLVAEAYLTNVEKVYRGTNMVGELNAEDLHRYFKTLVWLRVQQVTTNRLEGHDVRAYAIPAFVGLLLHNIGTVHDDDYGFTLVPSMEKPEDALDVKEMLRISKAIRSLRDAFQPVDFPLRSMRGSVEFMSKAVIGNVVMSYRAHDAQVYAYLAALVNQLILEEASKPFYYVTYGDLNYYHRDTPLGDVDFSVGKGPSDE